MQKTQAKPVANIDFRCFQDNCDGIVGFSLADADKVDFQLVCPKCHHPYVLDDDLRNKFERLIVLIKSIREAEDILGDSFVSVSVATAEVRVPYALLLTRLNTMITLKVGDRSVDFHLRIESSSPGTFS